MKENKKQSLVPAITQGKLKGADAKHVNDAAEALKALQVN